MTITTKFNLGESVNFLCYRTKEPMLMSGVIYRIVITDKGIRYTLAYALTNELCNADFWEGDLEQWNGGREKTE